VDQTGVIIAQGTIAF